MDFNDLVIFEDKTAADVFKEIHTNSNTKQIQIDTFLEQVSKLLTNATDAVMILPLMKEFLMVSVKNDESLIKMMTTIQRFTQPQKGNNEPITLLSDDEKNDLLNLEEDISVSEEEIKAVEQHMDSLMGQSSESK